MPAKDKECKYCHRIGHFMSLCRKRLSKRKVHDVLFDTGETSYSSESEVDELFIGELKVGTASKMPWLETIMIEKKQSNSN